MNKKISVGVLIMSILLAVLLTFQVTALLLGSHYNEALNRYFTGDSAKLLSKLEQVDSVFRKQYVGELDPKQLEIYAVEGYLYASGDKYSQYMTPEEWKECRNDLQSTHVGLGVIAAYNEEAGGVLIHALSEDGAAKRAGILVGDLLTAANGETLQKDNYAEIITKYAKDTKQEFELTVVRAGEEKPLTVAVTGGSYTEIYVGSKIFEVNGKKFGLVYISEFEMAARDQFRRAVSEMTKEGVDAILFDVRNNPGGELNTIISVIDYLVPDGKTIVTVTDKAGETEVHEGSDTHSVDLPMAVIANGKTASAAELFTCSLRDYGMAVIVGEKTYGKGCMQSLIELADGSAIRVTTGMYAPLSSANYDGVGIQPDVEIAPDEKTAAGTFYTLEPTEDNQIMAAIAALTK